MIGKRLRDARMRLNLTQDDVALHLNVKRQTYSAYERDVSIPDAQVLLSIAEYFGVTTDYLLGRAESPEILAAHRENSGEDLTPEQRAELEQFKQFIIERDRNKK